MDHRSRLTYTGKNAFAAFFVLCLIPVHAGAQLADGHPDFNGVWNSTAPSVFLKSEDPLAQNLASRDGQLLNFERDGALIRLGRPELPAPAHHAGVTKGL